MSAIEKTIEKLDERIAKAEKRADENEKHKQDVIAMGNMRPAGNSIGSDEARCLRAFGVGHVKQLLDVNTNHWKFKHIPFELKQLAFQVKSEFDTARMIQQIFGGEPLDSVTKQGETFAKVKGVLDSSYGKAILAPRLKAFGSTVSGAGDEWVPTAVASQYIEEYELERQVARRHRQVVMPSNPYDLPKQDGRTTARIQAEGGTITGTNFGTEKISFDATKFAEYYPLPEELNEDSAPDILAAARSEVSEAIMRAIETAIINGDDSGTHQDNDTDGGAANLAEKAWKGHRFKALANSANGSVVDFLAGPVTTAKIRSVRAALGKFGVNPRELIWLVSSKIWFQMEGLDEVTTVEKFGPQATILQGALAALDGIPIVISEFVRDDVDATGVNSVGGPNTFSTMHCINITRFYVGTRRPIRVRAVMDPTPPNDQWLIASWWRGAFEGHTQSASEVSTALGINIT